MHYTQFHEECQGKTAEKGIKTDLFDGGYSDVFVRNTKKLAGICKTLVDFCSTLS